jgi:putative hydrolase of the HAD superfamily
MTVALSRQRPLLVTDADNTLWDSDAVYANAQLALLGRVEKALGISAEGNDRLGFIRAVDQQLALTHHQHLRYPPRLLVIALTLTLSGVRPEEAAKRTVRSAAKVLSDIDPDEAARWFIEHIRTGVPELRRGVRQGLSKLHSNGIPVIVATEGQEDKCKKLIEHHELTEAITKIVSAPKTVELFQRLARLMGRQEEVCFMVGDQLDRDIALAKHAKFHTIYFPGGFKPTWTPTENGVAPEYRITTFAEIPAILAQLLQNTAIQRDVMLGGKA